MRPRLFRILAVVWGIVGSVAFVAYFSPAFTWLPLPPSDASQAQVASFGVRFDDAILWDAWLQATGSLLSVVFALALALGILFQILGVVGRFNTTAVLAVIGVLVAQNVWTVGAAVAPVSRALPKDESEVGTAWPRVPVVVVAR